MHPSIWSQLPNHLLEHVLSFLPLKTFLNLRSTCKHFNSLLFSPLFISKHSNLSSCFSSFILLSHPQFLPKCPLFNTVINSWCNISLPLPPILTYPPHSSNLLSSSNGRLCFSNPKSSCFIICNLLGKSFRKVKFPNFPFHFELLTLVSNSNGYKIFMLSSIGSTNRALIYDSVLDSWLQFRGFDPIINENYHQEGAFFKGCLFFTTPEPFHVVIFNLETGNWGRSMIDLPGSLTFARLVSDEDNKLYLIGGTGVSGISKSMKLWELINYENGDESWVEIETLPEMLCRKFMSVCYHNYEHVYCFWHEGLLCVCCYNWPEILYYKVSRRTWHWLPKCPSLPEKWNCGFRWFSFKPQIYATV